MADPATDAAIAAEWPEAWARANDPARSGASKRRTKLRKEWATAQKIKLLKAEGRSCRTCVNFGSTSAFSERETVCDLHSDFYGYQMAKPTGLCADWKSTVLGSSRAKGEQS